ISCRAALALLLANDRHTDPRLSASLRWNNRYPTGRLARGGLAAPDADPSLAGLQEGVLQLQTEHRQRAEPEEARPSVGDGAQRRCDPMRRTEVMILVGLLLVMAAHAVGKTAPGQRMDLPDAVGTAPASWTPGPLGGRFRLAHYRLPRAAGDSADPEVIVYYF